MHVCPSAKAAGRARPLQYLGALALLAAAFVAGHAQAASISVTNPSFEDPFVTGNGGFYQTGTPIGWTANGFSAQYIERNDNGGFNDLAGADNGITGANNQYIADDDGGILTQDLGVTFQPNTTYTVDIAGGHRSGFQGAVVAFGLRSSIDPTIDLAGATQGFILENTVDVGTFKFASALGGNGGVFTLTTGNTYPTGDLVVYIQSNSPGNGTFRLHADSVIVNAVAVPEPGSLILLGLGALGLCLAARRRPA